MGSEGGVTKATALSLLPCGYHFPAPRCGGRGRPIGHLEPGNPNQQVAASPQMPITPNSCEFYLLKVIPNGFIRIELFASFSDVLVSKNLHVLKAAETTEAQVTL